MIAGLRSILKILVVIFYCTMCLNYFYQTACAQDGPDFETTFDIPSSFNPVGSGARAIGMGSAFIAVADDATAASWNPGGLTQLDLPEISVVGSYIYRVEDLEFGTNPEANGRQSISEANLNFLSIVYPFNLFERNMVISLNYQQLFDFYRDWEFNILNGPATSDIKEINIDFNQSGDLYALGISYAVKILRSLSFGFTLNVWESFIYDNDWKATTKESGIRTFPGGGAGIFESFETKTREKFSFSGFNFNLGLLWNVTPKLKLGAVFKTPFTADLDYRAFFEDISIIGSSVQTNSNFFKEDQELDMPMSYGIGISYRPSDQFTISADISRTHWEDFILTDEAGNKTSPISGLPKNESDVDPTCQIRLGAEYLLIKQKYIIPLRGGLFYDPAPAEGNPDDFYGLSLGTGIGIERAALDIAYQYRFGRDVGQDAGGSGLRELKFSQDVSEHKIFASVIIYF